MAEKNLKDKKLKKNANGVRMHGQNFWKREGVMMIIMETTIMIKKKGIIIILKMKKIMKIKYILLKNKIIFYKNNYIFLNIVN
jgi:hypothetical protein